MSLHRRISGVIPSSIVILFAFQFQRDLTEPFYSQPRFIQFSNMAMVILYLCQSLFNYVTSPVWNRTTVQYCMSLGSICNRNKLSASAVLGGEEEAVITFSTAECWRQSTKRRRNCVPVFEFHFPLKINPIRLTSLCCQSCHALHSSIDRMSSGWNVMQPESG